MPAAQIGARASASSCWPDVPRGNFARDNAITPLSTSVTSRRCSGVVSPSAHMRVMSVVPPRYCAPESINSMPWLQFRVQFARCRVVRQRSVRFVARDGGKTFADEAGLLRTQLAQLRVHVQFGQALAVAQRLLKPARAAHQRHAVAAHRFADVLHFL